MQNIRGILLPLILALFLAVFGHAALAQEGPKFDRDNAGKTTTTAGPGDHTTITETGKVESAPGTETQKITVSEKDKNGIVVKQTETEQKIKQSLPQVGVITKKTKKYPDGEKNPANTSEETTQTETFERAPGADRWNKDSDKTVIDEYNKQPRFLKKKTVQKTTIKKGTIVSGHRTTTTYKDANDKNGTETEEVWNPTKQAWEPKPEEKEEKKNDVKPKKR